MTKRVFPDDFIPVDRVVDNGKITTSEIVAIAWDDETSFDNILDQTGMKEKDVIKIMRSNLKPSSFRMWRKRVSGRKTKHSTKSQQPN